jgi:hypothetical protein
MNNRAEFDTITLRELIVAHFSVDESRVLCSNFDLEYEDLRGSTKEAKVGDFVGRLDRSGRIQLLIASLEDSHPHVPWNYASKRPPIPVVVITMTKNEAIQLCQSSNSYASRILRLIEIPSGEQLCERYHEQNRDYWRPFGQDTIQEMLRRFVEQSPESAYAPSFQMEFEFCTQDFFSGNEVEDRVLKYITSHNALFIVDVLALFHPDIIERFYQAFQGREPRALFCLSPRNFRELNSSRQFEQRVRRTYRQFFIDHDENWNPHRGFLISNETHLQRSLTNSLRALGMDHKIPESWKQQFNLAGIQPEGLIEELQT